MEVETPSINAVPNLATFYIDRRLTFGEDPEAEVQRIRDLIPRESREAGDITVDLLHYDDPSYTGYVKVVDKIFPAWAVAEEHPLIQAGLAACRLIGLPDHTPGKWDFSTNGNYWAGRAGIPMHWVCPGGREDRAHRPG